MTNFTDIFTPGYIGMGMPNKIFNIHYIFNEYNAREKKRESDRLFRQTVAIKKRSLMITYIMLAFFIIIAPIFLVMFIKSFTTPEVLLNLSYRYTLIALVPVVCGLGFAMFFFKDRYDYYADITRNDIYTTAEKFFIFTNGEKNITDAKLSIEDKKVTLNIFYEEDDEELGTITKNISFTDFSILKTNVVQKPLLNIDDNIYYIPVSE